MASIADVIKFTPTLGGLTDWILATAATGYRTPSGNLTDGATYSYRAESSDKSEWEVGTGAWTTATSTLARTTVLYSSTGAKVNFAVAPSVAVVALTADVAPPDADYLVKTAHGGLSAERVVTDGAAAGKVNWDWTVAGTVKGVLYASAADKFLYATAADTWAEGAITAAGRALLDDTDAAAQRTTLGLGTGDSPQFTAINIGHASDTTITRTGAGDIAVEGNAVYRAGGTDVAVADGGTGASTLAANNVLLGNGTSALQAVAPSTSGNVLTSNGTTWTSAAPSASGGKAADYQEFTSSGTWTKPSGYSAESVALIQAWGGGGGAGRYSVANYAAGGGGGGYSERWILLSALGATETVTIGAGGAGRTGSAGSGTVGGNTTFGSLVTAYGGGGGGSGGAGGGGGGTGLRAGNTPAAATTDGITLADAQHAAFPLPNLHAGAFGKGGEVGNTYADAIYGGGGGGVSASTAGGTSKFGGAGGAGHATTPSNGVQPGGGGGGGGANVDGAAGGAGKCIVTVFDGA